MRCVTSVRNARVYLRIDKNLVSGLCGGMGGIRSTAQLVSDDIGHEWCIQKNTKIYLKMIVLFLKKCLKT